MVSEHATTVLEKPSRPSRQVRPTATQRQWLRRGLQQPGGKLPLFDHHGRQYSPRTIKSCLAQGWVEPWAANPIKPDWLICKLTLRGRAALAEELRGASDR